MIICLRADLEHQLNIMGSQMSRAQKKLKMLPDFLGCHLLPKFILFEHQLV
ncbi:hypothetical protein N9Y81_04215 [Akkermansiaceae bacterium]|nr:hypothetical protein [Akkermansiaceae bacterium]